MSVTLRSCSKINLGLAIGPTRPDGFHSLATLYQTLESHDLVTVTASAAGQRDPSAPMVELSCNDRRVPLDARNTVWKMLAAALAVPERATLRDRLQVKVHIEKRLPVQGGLGGGSANAAAALVGLERELARPALAPPLTGEQRLRLAAEVGSDVPLFLLGGAVLGRDRGQDVVPLEDLPFLHAVVALSQVGVSTPAAFRAWDAEQAAAGLTPEAMHARLGQLSRAFASAWCEQHATGVLIPKSPPGKLPGDPLNHQDLAGTLLSTLVQTGILLNDFEQVVFRQHPLLEQIKRALAGSPAFGQVDPAGSSSGITGGALYTALSGSGSAVFGLYAGLAEANAANQRLNTLGIRTLRTRTLGRAEYWAGMVVAED